MTLNTLGAVFTTDGEVPRTFTGRARTIISGGDLVVVSGAANSIGSGVGTFTTSDIVVDVIADSDYCNGIALNTTGSNGLVTVATRGQFIVRAAGIVSGGQTVFPVSGTIQGVAARALTAVSGGQTIIGRSVLASASGTALYTLVNLNNL